MVQPTAEVEVRDDPELPAVAVRLVRPMQGLDMGQVFGEAMATLGTHLGGRLESVAGPPYARYHEFGPSRADVEIGFPLEGAAAGLEVVSSVPSGEVGGSALPGGRRAVYLHRGPYPGLGHAYAVLESWFADQRETSAGPPWESYLNSPDEVDDPEQLLTEVCWPLA